MHTFGILITLQENKTILHIYNEGSVAGNVSKSECCKYMTILICFLAVVASMRHGLRLCRITGLENEHENRKHK